MNREALIVEIMRLLEAVSTQELKEICSVIAGYISA